MLPALALELALLLLCLSPERTHACTSIIVGRGASQDGSIYLARTDDTADARSTTNNLLYHPPRSVRAVFRANANRLLLTLPAPGLAYVALPATAQDPATGRNASGETSGVNSAGVAVSATETLVNSAKSLAADPYVRDTGVGEDSIPSLLLPQATSARQAVTLLGGLVEARGAAEGFGVLLGDVEEAWYLETASGHHWLAQRVPADAFFVSANQGRFQEVNLSDVDNVLSSPGLLDFAVTAGLHDPGAGPLNFFAAFMEDRPRDATVNTPRVHALQLRYAPTRAPVRADARAPPFLRPARQLGLADVVAGLRDHYEGSAHDAYGRRDPGEPWRPVAVLRSSVGHVTRLLPTNARPKGLSVVHYVAQGMPALSPFIPLHAGLPPWGLPPELSAAGSEPDARSLFWAARRLQALVFQDWPALAPPAQAAIAAFEINVEVVLRPAAERRYEQAMQRGDSAAAGRELAAFAAGVVQQALVLLVEQAEEAARMLALPGVPGRQELVRMLDAAAAEYAFQPHSNEWGGSGGGSLTLGGGAASAEV